MSLMNDKPFEFSRDGEWTKKAKNFDELNLFHYANVLGTFIAECETPMTIGLQGDWGIGKTTLLNMLQSELEIKQQIVYPIIHFNTWQYSLFGEDKYLGLAAINAMLNLLQEKFEIDTSDKSNFSKAAERITSVMKTVRFGFGPISVGSVIGISNASFK